MIVAGGWYPFEIAIGFIPLILFMKGSANRLRANFLAVVAAQGQIGDARQAARHGAQQHVARTGDGRRQGPSHRRRTASCSTSSACAKRTCRSARICARSCASWCAARSSRATEVDRVWQALFHNSREGDFVVPFETVDERAIEITVHRMTGEGAVVVVQDVTERRNAALRDRSDGARRSRHRSSQSPLLRRGARRRRCARAATTRESVNVLFLDLDDFKQVNDSLGHARGDKLLAAIARRLQAIVRPSDLVARWGGDEFAILQRPVTDPAADGGTRRARSSAKSDGRCSSTATK